MALAIAIYRERQQKKIIAKTLDRLGCGVNHQGMADQPKIEVVSAIPTGLAQPGAILIGGAKVEDLPAAPPRKQARRPRRQAQTRKPQKRATGGKRGRPKKYSARGIYSSVVKAFRRGKVARKSAQEPIGSGMRGRKKNLVYLSIGQTLLAVGLGVSVGILVDAGVQRLVSKNKLVRLAVTVAAGAACWFVGGMVGLKMAARSALGTALKLGAISSTVTGVILVGVDYVNEKARTT